MAEIKKLHLDISNYNKQYMFYRDTAESKLEFDVKSVDKTKNGKAILKDT